MKRVETLRYEYNGYRIIVDIYQSMGGIGWCTDKVLCSVWKRDRVMRCVGTYGTYAEAVAAIDKRQAD